ncbi:DNA mismatch repair endonuclease MutL [Xenorhabdus szentirmaii]|uniref:DNA mismatch repair protein MutL n=2 Tax=Xenorhabdus szentirmaii TaxID=290112 RepID=W1J796_9GAMM|nr:MULTISPECIES: DNA mismatch repair endonuclease MutL [Xenorhabdus]MBD2801362.1 DNA mismatch repair endonuclease MutL [Xenorhabdus sp. M]PHM34165.1 DNA mismatch repair protein MutL [Xenorhabdus szentirmaii DSM 16338]PHM42888.1 DNA mismatch repair protein MutL [Xenorhabdus szentirmaii]CDL85736.1 DNA mismatch repair protein mutL [Xenorhabdus szentirmaii DSM 16338]
MAIKILPPQLANQIAAGEVVERPASVIKELVENSLDSGATRIDIDIERGGAKLIRVRDNGCGISHQDLTLALARHATSKIASLDDLEAIVSMGFRGEALASISSVSRLTLTSRPEGQGEAWQAYAEGRDMNVTVKPAAHPVGTTVEVLDLFYNTPARRKFLRTEKTEFGHIDEVVRRIALARLDVAINLNHNGKLVRQYRPAKEESQHERRLAAICGTAFVQNALALSWQHDALSIKGWVADPMNAGVGDIQYCYVNRRMMRDRLINHAIRQAYQDLIQGEQQPAYVLYLEVDPHQVDVNVHPAKHEVRFHQARLVHDFIYQGVAAVLQQRCQGNGLAFDAQEAAVNWVPENRPSAGENHFLRKSITPADTAPSRPHDSGSKKEGEERSPAKAGGKSAQSHHGESYQKKQGEMYQKLMQFPPQEKRPLFPERDAPPFELSDSSLTPMPVTSAPVEPVIRDSRHLSQVSGTEKVYSFGKVLSIYAECHALIESSSGIALLSLPVAERWLRQAQLTPGDQGLKSQPLLIPLKLSLNQAEMGVLKRNSELLKIFGIESTVAHGKVTIHAVSLPLRQQNLPKLLPELLGYLGEQSSVSAEQVAIWFSRHVDSKQTTWNVAQAVQLLADVERLCPQLVGTPPEGLLQLIDLQVVVARLNHE